MSKKKQSYLERRKQDQVNTKAIVWTISIVGAVLILMIVLLILNR